MICCVQHIIYKWQFSHLLLYEDGQIELAGSFSTGPLAVHGEGRQSQMAVEAREPASTLVKRPRKRVVREASAPDIARHAMAVKWRRFVALRIVPRFYAPSTIEGLELQHRDDNIL